MAKVRSEKPDRKASSEVGRKSASVTDSNGSAGWKGEGWSEGDGQPWMAWRPTRMNHASLAP
jgi:hypothetical protein